MVPGPLDRAAHRHRPVLVVAGEDHAPVAGRIHPPGVQVGGVGVGQVVAVALGPADEVVGVADVQRQPGPGVRAVEGDRGGRLLLAQQLALLVPGVVEAGAGAAVLRVEVVRLPGHIRQHQQQVGGDRGRVRRRGRRGGADGERDVAAVPVVGGGQHRDMGAGAPVRRQLQPPGHPPVVAGDRPAGHQRRGLDQPGQQRAGRDVPRARPAVVPDPVDVDGELLCRADADPQVQRAADVGGGRGEALDLAADVVGGAGAAQRRALLVQRRTPGQRQLSLGQPQVHVPGDEQSGVVEVAVGAAQPGQRALAERISGTVRERARLPAAAVVHAHAPP